MAPRLRFLARPSIPTLKAFLQLLQVEIFPFTNQKPLLRRTYFDSKKPAD